MLTKLTPKYIIALFTTFFAIQNAYAINPLTNPLSDSKTLESWLDKIPGYFLTIVGPIFVVVLLIGGVQYLTSMGNPESSEKAKNTLLYGVIGLVVVVIGQAVFNWLVG